MSDEPVERQLAPGVFITDFRTPATANAITGALSQEAAEAKAKEVDEGAMVDAGAGSAVTSPHAHLTRNIPSTFPLDIPNDVESLELELEALAKNLAQLLKSNDILQEELKENPDDQVSEDDHSLGRAWVRQNDWLLIVLLVASCGRLDVFAFSFTQDFKDAIRENRVVIFRRSDRMQEVRAQLALIAPHRVETTNAQLAAAVAEQQAAAERDVAPAQQQQQEEEGGGGLFL
jgi:hypothetical protein